MDGRMSCFIALLVIFTSGASGLSCFQCSWSNNPQEFQKIFDLVSSGKSGGHIRHQNPIAKPYIGSKVHKTPNASDIGRLCDRTHCSGDDVSCLKWSFLSSSPINITYMCVLNPKRRSGCYRQQVKLQTVKSYLSIEACLCDKNFCNGATTMVGSVALVALLLVLTLYAFPLVC